jgi:hypothetical protein
MAGVTITMKRVDQRGLIAFEVPREPELQEALRKVLRLCRDKNNDYVAVTIARPYSPRTTGPKSQNHHLNGHIMQICNETNNDYEVVKYCVKMIATEQMGYPFQTIAGHIVPKRESDCNTEECAKLIEASHVLAAQMGVILREVNE